MMLRDAILVCSALFSCTLLVARKEELFIQTHLVDDRISAILDEHSELLEALTQKTNRTPYQKHGVWQFDWLPNYYVKYNTKRLLMREVLAKCIKDYGLNLLHVPQKYLHHIKGRPYNLSNLNYVIVVEELTEDPAADTEPMSLEQVKQFITLIEKTGHCSTFAHNYLRLSDGRISFIDTDGTFNKANPIRGIIDLLNRDLSSYYSSKALLYIVDRIAAHLVLLHGQDLQTALNRIATMLEDQEKSLARKLSTLLKERRKAHKKTLKVLKVRKPNIKERP